MLRMNPPRNSIVGVILAGGAGARLGGADKGWVDVAGRPLIVRALTALRPQASRIICVANRNSTAYAQLGIQVIADEMPGHQGPLAGLLTSFAHISGEWLLYVPADAYDIPPNLVQRLWRSLGDHPRSAAVVHDGTDWVPTCGLLSVKCGTALRKCWDKGERSLRKALTTLDPVRADFSDLPPANWSINTPAEWLAASVSTELPSGGR